MTIASNSLANGSTTGALTTIYTAPASHRTIVKCIIVRNAGGAAGAVAVTLARPGGGTSTWNLWCTATGTNGDTVVSLPWLVMLPGDVLKLQFPAAAGGWFNVSGAELAI